MTTPDDTTTPSESQDQENQNHDGQDQGDSGEFPFFQKIGDGLKDFFGDTKDLAGDLGTALKGQLGDAIQDVTDPIVRLKLLSQALSDLVDKYEAEQSGGESGQGEENQGEQADTDPAAAPGSA